MRDIMQYELPQPDLTVWEKTFLPTTSSKIKASLNGKHEVTSFVSKPSEDGDTGFLEKNWFVLHPILTESSSSPLEESWSFLDDTRISSSEMLCPYATSVLMAQPERLEHMLEGTSEENTSDEWPPTLSISGTSLERMVCGSLRQIISSAVSTIRRIGRSLLDSRG